LAISIEAPLEVTLGDRKFDFNYGPKSMNYAPIDPSYDNYTVLLDGHSHLSGLRSPEESILWHLAYGFNAMVVSQHNLVSNAFEVQKIAREKYNDKIKVIVGQEYSCCRIHMNLLGIKEVIMPTNGFPTDDELKRAINETHRQGGIVTANHFPWSYARLKDIPTLEQLFEWGIDFVEVVNGNTFDLQSYRGAKDHGLVIITGSDMHHPDMPVNGWTTLKPKNFSEEAIFEELVARRTSVIYSAIQSPDYLVPQITTKSLWLDPFYKVGDVFQQYYVASLGMYSFVNSFCDPYVFNILWPEFFVLIFWLAIAFVFFETIRQIWEFSIYPRLLRSRRSDQTMELEQEPFLSRSINDVWKS